ELSDTEASRLRRLCAAAEAAWEAGQVERARALVAQALPLEDGEQRTRLLALTGAIEGRNGRLQDAVATLLQAIDAGTDPSLALHIVRDACEFAVYAADFDRAADLCRRAAGLPAAGDRDQFIVDAFGAAAAELDGDHAGAVARSVAAIELAERLDDPRCLITAAITAGRVGIWGDGLRHADRAVTIARERALLTFLPF